MQNLIKLGQPSVKGLIVLQQMGKDICQLSDLSNSLLLFSKFDNDNIQSVFEEVRIDEVIFEALEQVHQSFPELKMEFVIADSAEESFLTINRVHSLLVLVFNNLLKKFGCIFCGIRCWSFNC